MVDLARLRIRDEPPTLRACGLRAALNVTSGKWKPLIVWHLLAGKWRAGALRRAAGEISEKVFVQQMRQLEHDGLVRRSVAAYKPLTVEYELTALGASLAPMLAAMSEWGFRHFVPAGDVTDAGTKVAP